MHTFLLERHGEVGGQASNSSRIENYLGFPLGLSGAELAESAREQAERMGAILRTHTYIIDARAWDDVFQLTCSTGHVFHCHSILIASGVDYRRLEAPGVDELVGRGVYYGALPPDVHVYENKPVYVVGGANSAGQAALYMAEHGASVNLLTRSALAKSMSTYLIERLEPLVVVQEGARVAAAHSDGEGVLSGVTIATSETILGAAASALLVFIGAEPRTAWVPHLATDRAGFILAGPEDLREAEAWPLTARGPMYLETSHPGIFVAGDVRSGSVKRVAAAAGEGAQAVQYVHRFIEQRGAH